MGLAEWLAAGAIVLAVWPIFQMVWGRPDISFAFNRINGSVDTHLFVHLYNLPIPWRFLASIGVRRDEAKFHVGIIIKHADGNMLLRFSDPPPGSGNPYHQNLLSLSSGLSPHTLEILGANGKCARTYTENRKDSFYEYAPGTYGARIEVFVGEKMFYEERSFVVTHNPIHSYWADN